MVLSDLAASSVPAGSLGRDMVGEPDGIRIRRLVTHLHGAAASVAAQSGASGFSVAVGLPFGVSVRVEWEHR